MGEVIIIGCKKTGILSLERKRVVSTRRYTTELFASCLSHCVSKQHEKDRFYKYNVLRKKLSFFLHGIDLQQQMD